MNKGKNRKVNNTIKKLNKRKSTLDILQKGDNIIITYNSNTIHLGRIFKVSLKKGIVVEKYSNHLIILDKSTNRRNSVNYHSVLCGEISVNKLNKRKVYKSNIVKHWAI